MLQFASPILKRDAKVKNLELLLQLLWSKGNPPAVLLLIKFCNKKKDREQLVHSNTPFVKDLLLKFPNRKRIFRHSKKGVDKYSKRAPPSSPHPPFPSSHLPFPYIKES